MAGEIGERIAEWGQLTRGRSLEAVERFLGSNRDLMGFIEERGDATFINSGRNGPVACQEFAERIGGYGVLRNNGCSGSIAKLIMKNPDFIDLPILEVVSHYESLRELGVSDVAAAVFASTDYSGRGSVDLKNMATEYHVARSSETFLQSSIYEMRYRKLFSATGEVNHRELRLAFRVIDGLNDESSEAAA